MRNTKKAIIENYFNVTGQELLNDLPTYLDARISGAIMGNVTASIDLRKHILDIKLVIISTVKEKALRENNKKIKLLEKTYDKLLSLKPEKTKEEFGLDDYSDVVAAGKLKKYLLKRYFKISTLTYKTNKDLEDALYGLGKLNA